MKAPSIREWSGSLMGTLLSPAIATISHARSARMFHPDGLTFSAHVSAHAGVKPEFAELADRLHGSAIARFSGALWRRGFEHFDVLGIAVRFLSSPWARTQDLLFATIRSPFTMGFAPFTTKAGDYFANTYWAVSPFNTGGVRNVKFRLRPPSSHPSIEGGRDERLTQAVAIQAIVWTLEIRPTFTKVWTPLATLALVQRLDIDDESLRFSPFRCGRGIIPRGFVHALRRAVYPASQRARPAHE